MEALTHPRTTNWKSLTLELGQAFGRHAAQHDKDGQFVFENYETLKQHAYFSAAIPAELGGGGATHAEMCSIVRVLAQYCGSTALAFAMHQHLVAAAIWRFKHKGEARPMLEKVVAKQLVLVSTGARDWIESNGELIRTDGGYLLTAKKHFASQALAGDIVVTSAQYQHPDNGWEVLHFSVPMKTEGISILDDWETMGMRASGSQTIVFNKTFIPDAAIVLARPRNGYHPVWDVVITVAMPLIMSVYVGLAEKAMEIALTMGKNYARNQTHLPYLIGKMNNSLVSARTQYSAMIALAANLDFKPNEVTTIEMLSLKSNVADTCMQTAQEAMEAIGGQSFYKRHTLERIFRDIQGAQYHPLPKWDQYTFTGERLIR